MPVSPATMINFFTIPYVQPFNPLPEPSAMVEEVRQAEPEVKLVFHDPPKWTLFSCIETAKYILGKQASGSWGNAWNLLPDKNLGPEVGLVVLTKEGSGHVAVVVSKSGDIITIKEGNYKRGTLTTRTLEINNPLIRGYKRY